MGVLKCKSTCQECQADVKAGSGWIYKSLDQWVIRCSLCRAEDVKNFNNIKTTFGSVHKRLDEAKRAGNARAHHASVREFIAKGGRLK